MSAIAHPVQFVTKPLRFCAKLDKSLGLGSYRSQKMLKTISCEQALIGYLHDHELAIEYLNAALEEGDSELFKTALKNIATASGKGEDWVEQLVLQMPSLDRNQLVLLLKELNLGFYLQERANRGSLQQFKDILARVPANEPEDYDRP
jgi:hypothetical protein